MEPMSPVVLPGLYTTDSIGSTAPHYDPPVAQAQGKLPAAVSLMRPLDLARRLLPADTFRMLETFSQVGVPTDCGPHWAAEVITKALEVGPHVSALTEENILLVWDDLSYQEEARFVQIVTATELLGIIPSPKLKILRIAVVPQAN